MTTTLTKIVQDVFNKELQGHILGCYQLETIDADTEIYCEVAGQELELRDQPYDFMETALESWQDDSLDKPLYNKYKDFKVVKEYAIGLKGVNLDEERFTLVVSESIALIAYFDCASPGGFWVHKEIQL